MSGTRNPFFPLVVDSVQFGGKKGVNTIICEEFVSFPQLDPKISSSGSNGQVGWLASRRNAPGDDQGDERPECR